MRVHRSRRSLLKAAAALGLTTTTPDLGAAIQRRHTRGVWGTLQCGRPARAPAHSFRARTRAE